MKLKNFFLVGLALGLAALTLTACSSKSGGSAKQDIIVATDSDTAPFTFTGKDNKQTGYDIEVMKAIFKGSKKYHLKFETAEFESILPGIDSDRYQIAANDFNYNADRAKKYLFSDPISVSNYAIVTKSGTKYDKLEQLSGKSTEALAGSNYAQTLEDWNKQHPDKEPIKVNYVSGQTGFTSRLQDLDQGKIDFIFYDQISSSYAAKDQGFDFTVSKLQDKVGSNKDGKEYLLFGKTDQGKELQAFVNRRIKTLQKDGTLKKLSQKYFGGDYVSSLK
ncbi:amino acid ABC transporter substrate-binding protein [Streptococcus criceti]|uniref:ABC transporter, substrate-binding protein n=1 Tax=Streptococcus criceti HS-6 TaxID=873449 RepID=G5JRR6_STRCG|nr:transporter substrate-binding domain-containing protein [Streptococcus criceti]EHI73481.1 ABC transporter, substrate-binding protein [Streptococcus criceti HS-6]SUN43695.1 amino acid ABC transporter substrate-binding protein [Streptococcus criceti]